MGDDDDIPDQEMTAPDEKKLEALETQDELYSPSSSQRPRSKRKEWNEMAQHRINTVLESHDAVEKYTYDIDNELWCEVKLLKQGTRRVLECCGPIFLNVHVTVSFS